MAWDHSSPRRLTDEELDKIDADLAKGGENGLDFIDGNNDGELLIALDNIARMMKAGHSYEKAVRSYGIRGHPAFADFWPVTELWGDAAWAHDLRQQLERRRKSRPT